MFSEPKPNVTTSGFAFDRNGRFPILYRGPNVRSARNIWSLPSGLHECGFTLGQQFCVELKEECNLEADPKSVTNVAVYENIAPDIHENADAAQWHWVLHILAVRVKTLESFVNKEPDKHPEIRFVTTNELRLSLDNDPWHPSLREALVKNFAYILQAKRRCCHGFNSRWWDEKTT